jgi:hypothetical protein
MLLEPAVRKITQMFYMALETECGKLSIVLQSTESVRKQCRVNHGEQVRIIKFVNGLAVMRNLNVIVSRFTHVL